MRRALLAIPTFVASSGLGLVTPTDVTLVRGDVGQHRLVVILSAALHVAMLRALRRSATASFWHDYSLRAHGVL
jgi:hypothetical protein